MDYVYDLRTDALHITVHPGTVHRSVQDANLILDYDNRGWLVSLTILTPSENMLRSVREAKEARGSYSTKITVDMSTVTG